MLMGIVYVAFNKKCQILFFFGSYFLYFCLTYLLVALYMC